MRALRFFAFLFFFSVTVSLLAAGDIPALINAGQADLSINELRARVSKNPADAEAYSLLCRVYLQLDNWDDAVRAGEKAVALNPAVSDYHMWLARAYGRKAEKVNPFSAMSLARKFRSEMERAISLDPDNLPARADLADFYLNAPGIIGGGTDKAQQQAEYVLRKDPAQGHFMRAAIEEHQKTGKAEAEYKAAISASNNLADYWVGLAGFYQRQGRLKEMQAAVDKSLTARRQDNNNIFLFSAGELLYQAGRDFPEAIKMLRMYLSADELAEDGPAFRAHYYLGKLLEQQGKREEAAAEYRAALALASQYRPAQDALAQLSR